MQYEIHAGACKHRLADCRPGATVMETKPFGSDTDRTPIYIVSDLHDYEERVLLIDIQTGKTIWVDPEDCVIPMKQIQKIMFEYDLMVPCSGAPCTEQ